MKSFYSVLFFFSLSVLAGPTWCQQTSALYYFNSGAVTGNSFFELPALYGTTSGTDTARTIEGYSERFTCPYANTFLDSVTIVMATDSFGPDGYLLVEAVPVTWTSGHSFANFNQDSTFASAYVDTVTKKDTAQLYSFPMSHTAITDTDFFISTLAPDPAQTITFLWTDSVTSPTPLSADEDRDRSRLLLDLPYKGNYQYYVAGTYRNSLYWYPNFAEIAYVSSPAGSVAQMYPVDQDPLTFYVEWEPNGETNMHFTIENSGEARLDLFDASGRLVATLFDAGVGPGAYDVPLPSSSLANGMYFAKLSSGNNIEMRQITVAH